ncbi:MAG TPA: DUF4197 domain-containing protein, partial [Flavisolibacter sp.]|nr:DUF4197 domain-containing protein [Flavisolibacter sp.]
MIKRYIVILLLITGLHSCETLSNLPTTMGSTITQDEAAQGIREALDQGVGRGIGNLNRLDGFFGNEAYKLLLPPDARRIENTMRQLGFGSMVDKAILQINRSAEDAVGAARPIFVDAIRQMTITDAINIIRGPRDAATEYFREKTTDRLISAFLPIIKNSLDKFE